MKPYVGRTKTQAQSSPRKAGPQPKSSRPSVENSTLHPPGMGKRSANTPRVRPNPDKYLSGWATVSNSPTLPKKTKLEKLMARAALTHQTKLNIWSWSQYVSRDIAIASSMRVCEFVWLLTPGHTYMFEVGSTYFDHSLTRSTHIEGLKNTIFMGERATEGKFLMEYLLRSHTQGPLYLVYSNHMGKKGVTPLTKEQAIAWGVAHEHGRQIDRDVDAYLEKSRRLLSS